MKTILRFTPPIFSKLAYVRRHPKSSKEQQTAFRRLGMLVLLMMFTFSCVPEEPLDSENRISDPEVLKAKVWFESQEANLSRINGENFRNNSSSFEKRPNWNLTKKHKNAAGQEVLEVSLQVNKTMVSRYILEKFKNNRPRPHQISQNLLMVEKGNGVYDVFIFKIHSETDLSVNNRRDFFYEVNYGKTPSEFSGELLSPLYTKTSSGDGESMMEKPA